MTLFTAEGGEEEKKDGEEEKSAEPEAAVAAEAAAPAEAAPAEAEAVATRKSSIGGDDILEVFASIKGRAIWQWDAASCAKFFAEDFHDEEGEEIALTGEAPAETTGVALIKGEAGLNEADAAAAQTLLSHTAALFMGDIALMADIEQRDKIIAELNVSGAHIPFNWDGATTAAKLDSIGISHPDLTDGFSLFKLDWDIGEDDMEKLAEFLEKEAWAFMVDAAASAA
jgi:hypothetical protein